jgi:hypothetical protein
VDVGTQAGHGAPQLHDAAGIAAIANHLVNACGAQPRMLLQGLAYECNVGIDYGRTQGLCTSNSLRFDGIAHSVRMDTPFTGNGADLPVLGVKVAANLHTGLGTDHERAHLFLGMCEKGFTKRPVRPQNRQRSHRPVCAACGSVADVSGPQGNAVTDRGGTTTGVAFPFPHREDAEQVIEREPLTRGTDENRPYPGISRAFVFAHGQPSRAPGLGDAGRPADGHGDRAVLPDSAGAGG